MSTIQLGALVLYLSSLLFVLKRIDWASLKADRPRQLALVNATALLSVFWFFRLTPPQAPDLHFLLVTALTLTLGFRLALISASVVLLALLVFGQIDWSLVGIYGLTTVMVPVTLSYSVYAWLFHRLTRHFLVYVFLCAFLPAALVLSISMGLMGGYMIVDGLYEFQAINDNYWLVIVLLAFPEALLNGAIMTMLVVFKPNWVHTFHDKFYFDQ